MFVSQSGKVRRMDLIITPHEEYPFCLLGWTGSKQYLRFLRQHAGNCNMYLNSHRQACSKHACLLTVLIYAAAGSADTQLTLMSCRQAECNFPFLATPACCKTPCCWHILSQVPCCTAEKGVAGKKAMLSRAVWAKICTMCRLMRKEGQQSCVVPQEGPPFDRSGKPWWPPGWDENRVVKDEGDIMELLGVPRREPHERNCP